MRWLTRYMFFRDVSRCIKNRCIQMKGDFFFVHSYRLSPFVLDPFFRIQEMNLASCLSAYPLVMWSGLGRGQELPIGKVGWSSDGYLEGNFHIFFFENPGFFHEITIWKFIIVNSSIFKVFSDVLPPFSNRIWIWICVTSKSLVMLHPLVYESYWIQQTALITIISTFF